MTLTFVIIAVITLAGAIGAMTQRNLVHCALALTLAIIGLAMAYLQLSAQFVGLAQILVYIGAVAILIVFAILLTRSGEPPQTSILSSSWIAGVAVALLVFGVLTGAIASSGVPPSQAPPEPTVEIRQIGLQLMTKYILPLEVVGLLLTAALIGAVIIAMHEQEAK